MREIDDGPTFCFYVMGALDMAFSLSLIENSAAAFQ